MVDVDHRRVAENWPRFGMRDAFNPKTPEDLVNAFGMFLRSYFHLQATQRAVMVDLLQEAKALHNSMENGAAKVLHVHAGEDITTGILPDVRIQASGVTQHEAALSIDGPQVDSGTLPDARIQASGVTQHEAALSIAGPQVDSGILPDARIQATGVTQHEGSIDQVASPLQIGSGGPQWKNDTDRLRARNAADSADAEIVGAAITGTVVGGTELQVLATKVVGARKTGWTALTGTATRTAFDTTTVTLEQLAERVKAHLDDDISHGLIGS